MFQPVIPVDGLAGWRFLQRTYASQADAFNASVEVKRDADYFAERIGAVQNAEELVADRQLLSVALGAFGLQDDINNRFFIQKVLEEGTQADDALANRLSDTRYRALSKTFGFGPGETPRINDAGFADGIIARFQANGFEVAAGEQNDSLRVALYAERVLPELAGREISNNAKWFTILGDPPLRQMFEKALALPQAIGQIDIDQQLTVFKDRAQRVFGTDELSFFGANDAIQDAIDKFIARDQLSAFNTGASGASIALTLLQG